MSWYQFQSVTKIHIWGSTYGIYICDFTYGVGGNGEDSSDRVVEKRSSCNEIGVNIIRKDVFDVVVSISVGHKNSHMGFYIWDLHM